ncbi:MAG: c-type cytochrome [Oceanospirillaceae bacterium]|nr:c-type cytochrome [Oceanospirillaceae bacterium]
MVSKVVVTLRLYLCILLLCWIPKLYAFDLVHEPISPIPAASNLSPEKIELGESLFHDVRLSKDNSISCASCHNLSKGGTDNQPVSRGVNDALGSANAPTVYNSALNFMQFWDGRAFNLREQTNGPVHNPVEMNSNWPEITHKLSHDRPLSERFARLYPEGLTADNIQDAIATFEASLLTSHSPFDRWLKGDAQALSEQQIQGYRLFKSYGCISCHQGANVGGNMFAYLGAVNNVQSYFQQRGTPINPPDYGRYNVTGELEDKYLFKVPSLRLAVKTAPYFHDGSVSTLQEAIRLMARYQLGREIPDNHTEAIIIFLHSLVGEHPRLTP